MRSLTRFAALMLVIASLFASATVALAAPVPWSQVEVTLHSEPSGGTMLVAGDLPEGAKLPAEVELSVPSGSTLMWIGELLGGPSSADPAVTYVKRLEGGADVYRVTMTKGRSAQIEVAAPADSSADGSTYSSALSWVASADVPRVLLSARIPASARIDRPAEGGEVFPSDATYAFYSKTFEKVKAGDTLELAFGYTATAAAVGASGTTSGSDTVLIVTMLLALVVGVALIAIVARTKMGSRGSDGADAGAAKPSQPTRAAFEADAGSASIAPDEDEALFDDDDPAEESIVNVAQRRGRRMRLAIAGVVVLVLAVFVAVVVVQAAKPKVVGDTISQIFAGGEPCEIASVVVLAPAGADPVGTAESLFAALKTANGINDAKYSISASVLEVGYCGSQTTEDAVLGALAPTGLVGAAPAAPPTTASTSTAPATVTPAP